MSSHWYTVEYDENSIAWLVDDKQVILCLTHGMQLYIAGQLVYLPLSYEADTMPEPPAQARGEEGECRTG